ncbi:uncharacterized protein Z518_05570 [Rhinocladiella mackenziei CBS 650.93]|uniref:Uncharacterized protein n=1 Tax=Rhinocladiella mackenziei CBS 650.93 TaxID=1442369 RepID=A0A0D2J6M6_9EURO|nr:uncharacterized protein Z518_05570 [Rhinocladiella mackenziei CBS 650.93]KIX04700.1 hypothetical protein Z518_05570 [Rhinocladiella mackenziei CBS 650.93]
MELSPSTWRILGLSVTAGYIGLGTFAITQPVLAAQGFGIYPESTPPPSTNRAFKTDKDEHASAVTTSMLLLGARDLTIGLALASFDYQENPRAMGTLILSSFVLCGVDVHEIWKLRGPAWGCAFAVGASIWMAIGYGMIQ